MTKRTKTTCVIATLYCVVLMLMLGSILYVVQQQGTKLEQAKNTIAEQAAKQIAYDNIVRVVESSASDRQKLNSYFISDKDTISFISELESAAKTIGVEMQTTNLSVMPATTVNDVRKPAILSVGVKAKGSEVAVKKYISLLENVPYHKTITKFTYTNSEASVWTAETTLNITMKP